MPRGVNVLLGAALLLAGLGLPDASGDSPDGAFTEELKAMTGTWKPVSAENNGFPSAEGDLRGTRWVRDADGTWAFRRDDKTILTWKVKAIDAAKRPKAIDIEVADGPHKGTVYKGIYDLDGDTLRICFALPDRAERPTEFKAGKGSVCALSEFTREKP